MTTTKAYDTLVEGFRAKISGNISSVKMTPQECEAEIAQITDGAKSSFEEPGQNLGEIIREEIARNQNEIQPKKRRGRPAGVKNKPKVK